MHNLDHLYKGFFLGSNCANSKISDGENVLRVAPIKKTTHYEKLEINFKHFAFAEKNEYFYGLKNFLWIESPNFPPIFIFDNHNHAPIFRFYCNQKSNINSPTLIHIDQHSDCRENKNQLKLNQKGNEVEKIFNFFNQKCNVGNFIPPALESGIIGKQIQIRSTISLQNLEIEKNQNYILDIDLDFCLDGIDRNKVNGESVNLLKKKFDEIGKFALCTTIATSPYFLNQDLAIDIIEVLLTK